MVSFTVNVFVTAIHATKFETSSLSSRRRRTFIMKSISRLRSNHEVNLAPSTNAIP